MSDFIIVHPDDTVAVAARAISKGEDMTYSLDGREVTVKALDDVPLYHKIAIKNVKKGASVLKYGEIIGRATADIKAGNHVHVQNLSDLVVKAEEDI